MGEREELGGRPKYFAINDRVRGLSTGYRVSGRLGECSGRYWDFSEAERICRLMNRVYRLGLRHGAKHKYIECDIEFIAIGEERTINDL